MCYWSYIKDPESCFGVSAECVMLNSSQEINKSLHRHNETFCLQKPTTVSAQDAQYPVCREVIHFNAIATVYKYFHMLCSGLNENESFMWHKNKANNKTTQACC